MKKPHKVFIDSNYNDCTLITNLIEIKFKILIMANKPIKQNLLYSLLTTETSKQRF